MRNEIVVQVAGLSALADGLELRLARASVQVDKLKPHFGAEMK